MTPEELLNKKNVYYRHSGGDLLIRCLNPEHEDNNPSLRVDKLTGKFNCFSCSFSGSLFKHFDEDQNILNLRVQSLKEKINKLYKKTLHIPLTAIFFDREYRDISPETFKRFDAFINENDKDMEGRVIFPIRDENEDIVVFQGRYLNSELKPKYKNYPGGVPLPMFPTFPDEIIGDSIILVEGIFDMLNLWDKGLKNSVCIFGASAMLSKDSHVAINKFSQYKLQGVNKLVTMFDGDKAGRMAAKTVQKHLSSSYIIENIDLGEGNDAGALSQEDVNSIKEYLYD